MNRALVRTLLCLAVSAAAVGAATVPAAAFTACVPSSCTWNDVPDSDFATGTYVAGSPLGIANWRCDFDGDMNDPCYLTVSSPAPLILLSCSGGVTFTGPNTFTNRLPNEGIPSTCVFVQTPGAPVMWTATGSSSGTIN